MDFQRIDPGRQFDPNQKAGFGRRYARARWEAGVNPGDNGPHTFRNPQLQVPQVPVIISAGEDLVRRGLYQRRARPFPGHAGLQHCRVIASGGNPANSPARRQGFRQRTAINHISALVEGFTRGRTLRATGQIAVDIVLN